MRFVAFFALLQSVACAADFSGFVDTYCIECHDSDAKKGGLDLSRFRDESTVMKDRAVWRSVYEKVESQQMPPPKRKAQPSPAEREALQSWIMDIAARPDPALGVPDPGKPVLRRLTRLEYNNSIRDLFGLPLDVFMFAERLPIDHKHFDPSASTMGSRLHVPVREPGERSERALAAAGSPPSFKIDSASSAFSRAVSGVQGEPWVPMVSVRTAPGPRWR